MSPVLKVPQRENTGDVGVGIRVLVGEDAEAGVRIPSDWTIC